MAFIIGNLTLWSVPPTPPQYGLPQWWAYSTDDDLATVAGSGYFNLGGASLPNNTTFFVGDQLYCVCSDGVSVLQIATVGSTITTTASSADIPAGSITHAMLGSKIVEASNIADNTITATQIADNTITSTQLALNTIQFATVTGIDPTTLYSVGTSLVAAPGAGKIIVPLSLAFNYVYSTAQYTSGGAIGVQYGTTIHQGGQLCSATLAAATFNGYAANEMFGLAVSIAGASSASINKALYLTAATGDFATGAGTVTAFVSYIVVSAS